MLTLAQSIDPKIWFYFALLLAMVLLGAIIIFTIRRNLFSNDRSVNPAGGGLLEHLDEMKRSGKITQEEYNTTRATIIQNAKNRIEQTKAETMAHNPFPDDIPPQEPPQ
ncbi:MAG: hypothetical protein ACWA5W_08195 [Phycisphaerales bacterium]